MTWLVSAFGEFITTIGKIGLGLQALGIVVVITIFFNFVAFLLNRKRLKEIANIKQDMSRIESKIDDILTQSRSRNQRK